MNQQEFIICGSQVITEMTLRRMGVILSWLAKKINSMYTIGIEANNDFISIWHKSSRIPIFW